MCLNIFWGFFCCRCLVLFSCDLTYRGLFQFSWICWDLFCVLKYDLFWRRFHELHKRMCIPWLLGEILCRCLLWPIGLICAIALKFLCWSFASTTYLFWWIVPLINMKWLSLSLLTGFSLKSTLSDIRIVLLPVYGVCLFLSLGWVSYMQSMFQSFFFNTTCYSMSFDRGIEAICIQC
jgi:hypothetical protein